MDVLFIVLFFVYGTIFGSFFNVVGLRAPKKESVVSPSSSCTDCGRKLTYLDLVPVFSYLLLGGKCRGCGVRISPIYPLMELVTGALFTLAYIKLGFGIELAVALVFISLLVIITISDIAYMLIPNSVLLPFTVVLFGLRVISPLMPWWDSLVGAVIGFGLLLLIGIVSKGGMGGGDIKLLFVVGLVLGTLQTLLTLFFAAVIGAIVGVIIIKQRGQSRKTPIPFGPSISIAAVISYFWGAGIVEWYGMLFL